MSKKIKNEKPVSKPVKSKTKSIKNPDGKPTVRPR